MEINLKEFRKWIEALDSGKYSQTKRVLNDSFGFCCLGVACDVTIKKEKIYRIGKDNFIYGRRPENQKYAPAWLKEISEDFDSKTGDSLVWLNDGCDFTFPEIATMLELVYIHKAL